MKYAVIFRADVNKLDDAYVEMAARMRELAMDKYGCTEFVAVTEDANEIAISYWQSLEQIKQWKQDVEHLAAQKLGKSRWYKSYQIQVVGIIREYSSTNENPQLCEKLHEKG